MTRRRSHRRGGQTQHAESPPPQHAESPPPLDDVETRAARLGITPERVLEEYRRIAFANLRHIVEWTETGMVVKAAVDLNDEDVAAIAEIVETAATGKPYRVKLFDKKAALDALARHLSMFPLPPRQHGEPAPAEEGEDPRAFLERELARLAAAPAEEAADLVSDPGAGPKTEA